MSRPNLGTSLIEHDDVPPFEIVNGEGQSNVVLVCDHASHRVPQRLGTLGLEIPAYGSTSAGIPALPPLHGASRPSSMRRSY